MTTIIQNRRRNILVSALVLGLIIIGSYPKYFNVLPSVILSWLGHPVVQLILTLPVLVWAAQTVWYKIWQGIKLKKIVPEFLVGLFLFITFIYSIIGLVDPNIIQKTGSLTHMYFDAISLVILVNISIQYAKDYIDKKNQVGIASTLIERDLVKKAQYLSLIVVLMAIINFVFWFYLIKLDFVWSLTIAISLLVVCSSESLQSSATLILTLICKRALDKKIIINNRDSLEKLRKVDRVIFDTTQTISDGGMIVTDLVAARPNILLQWVASLEAGVDHPIARAVEAKGQEKKIDLQSVIDKKVYPGLGVVGIINGQKIVAGNMALMRQEGIVVGVVQREKTRLEQAGKTVIILGIAHKSDRFKLVPGELVGLIGLSSNVRKEFKTVVTKLAKLNVESWLLTGKSPTTAQALAEKIAIPQKQIIADILPGMKEQALASMHRAEAKNTTVLVATNQADVRVIKYSDVYICLGDNHPQADISITNDALVNLIDSIQLARFGHKKISENYVLALSYNVIALVVISSLGFATPYTTFFYPLGAILFSSFATLVIIGNSLTTNRSKLN